MKYHDSTIQVRYLIAGLTLLILIALHTISAYSIVAPDINQGATIFIGEQGLNVTHAMNQAYGPGPNDTEPVNTTIGWWASAAQIDSTYPTKTVDLGVGTTPRYKSMEVEPSDFVGYVGNWYVYNSSSVISSTHLAFAVADPALSLAVWDVRLNTDVTGRSVPQGEMLTFRIDTNMYQAISSGRRSPVYNNQRDGYIDIKVKDKQGILLSTLLNGSETSGGFLNSLTAQNVSTSLWYWGSTSPFTSPGVLNNWATDARYTDGSFAYPQGTYAIWAESQLNNMKNNYRNAGADYTGKTISRVCTITIVPDALKIEANRDSVARGTRFSVTVTGKPKTQYYLWVKNTGSMTGKPDDHPPVLFVSDGVYQDPVNGPSIIGSHPILGGGGRTIIGDIPLSSTNVSHTEYYAAIMTSESGSRTIEFVTPVTTKPGTYILRVESDLLSDEVPIQVVHLIDTYNGPVTGKSRIAGKVIYHPIINTRDPIPPDSGLTGISHGATVFIGESGLNISPAFKSARATTGSASSVIGWWASAAMITTTAPTKTLDLTGRHATFFVSPADFVGYMGNWYLVNPSTGSAYTVNGKPVLVLSVADPSLYVRIWDMDLSLDMSGRSVPHGDNITFWIDTNMFPALDPQSRPNISVVTPGYITIKVKDGSGATLNYLYQDNSTVHTLVNLPVNSSPWFFGGGATPGTYFWATDLLDRDHYWYYPTGTYTVWAESALNGMKTNYKNAGADYTGKTVSQTNTVTLVTDSLKIEANKDSVVRQKPFSVTLTGKPRQVYHVWVENTSTMKGTIDDQPPYIVLNQEGVMLGSDPGLTGSAPVFPDPGGYEYEDGHGKMIYQDVAPGWPGSTSGVLANGTRLYADVKLSSSGTRTIEFTTTNWTRVQNYRIRAEQVFPVTGSATMGEVKRDEVDVNVRRAAVTIDAAGNLSYSLGDEIRLSGTNTGTYKVHLFLTGPYLPPQGAQINSQDPKNTPIINNDISTFKTVDVNGDNTWSWRWNTTAVQLDAGTYTLYAVSQPRDNNPEHLHDADFGTVNITIRKPIISIPGYSLPPTDPDQNGVYEDLNGNGRLDFADVVLYFNQMEWIAANEPVSAFDLNGNGRIDFADIVKMFGTI